VHSACHNGGEQNMKRLLNIEFFARRQRYLSQEPLGLIARARQSNYQPAQLPQLGRHEISYC